ncbi:MAG: hypothetical protein WCL59_02105 [Cyanobium sp. ELA507]
MAPSDFGSLPDHAAAAGKGDGPGTANRPGEAELAALAALAESLADDPAGLLDLLRRLEQLHRSIQDGPFRSSLPADRHRLFQLLEAMEDSGGWPYIPRLQLRTFMDLMQREAPLEAAQPGQSQPVG